MLQLGTMYIHVIMSCVHISTTIMEYICCYFSIMMPIDTISIATTAPLLKYNYSTMLWL